MPDTPDMHKALFMELTMMLSSSAMQYLGKIINPMTGKTELNLEAAQATIDMIEMISVKTKGNLDKDEDRLLKTTLTGLKMNYVETASTPPAKTDKAEKPATTTDKPAEPAAAETKDATPETDDKAPKFHKSYS